MAKVYLSLGTNLGDKEKNLRTAVQKIEEQIGNVCSLSAFYITPPWGFESDNPFLNAAVCIETNLTPFDILHKTQSIEKELGRDHKSINGTYKDRIIDIDLLLYNNLVVNTQELTLPHPLMTERLFVIQPLAEIAPELPHPVFQKSIATLLSDLQKNNKNTEL